MDIFSTISLLNIDAWYYDKHRIVTIPYDILYCISTKSFLVPKYLFKPPINAHLWNSLKQTFFHI